jgi:hypothetical protein
MCLQMRGDPERIAADADVPFDVPLYAPAGDELGQEEAPEGYAGNREGLVLARGVPVGAEDAGTGR